MLILLGHKGNENENHIMIPPHSIRIVTIKDTNNLKWWRCGENWTFMQCWWECKLVQSLWKKSMRSLLKTKIELPYDTTILLGIFFKACESIKTKAPADPCLLQPYSQDITYGNSQDPPLLWLD
jgi:hypothetical protein